MDNGVLVGVRRSTTNALLRGALELSKSSVKSLGTITCCSRNRNVSSQQRLRGVRDGIKALSAFEQHNGPGGRHQHYAGITRAPSLADNRDWQDKSEVANTVMSSPALSCPQNATTSVSAVQLCDKDQQQRQFCLATYSFQQYSIGQH